MMKICKMCGNKKEINNFHKCGTSKNGNINYRPVCKECTSLIKRVKEEDRVVPIKEITDNIIYKKCKQMAYSAYARIYAPSKRNKHCYNNLNEPFGFCSSSELKWYLYNNFYNDIELLLKENKIPSIDRINPSIGYTKENIRIISFKENTVLGVKSLKKKVKSIDKNGDIIIFDSVTDCCSYFSKVKLGASRVKSWILKDGKYKIPEGYMFEYLD